MARHSIDSKVDRHMEVRIKPFRDPPVAGGPPPGPAPELQLGMENIAPGFSDVANGGTYSAPIPIAETGSAGALIDYNGGQLRLRIENGALAPDDLDLQGVTLTPVSPPSLAVALDPSPTLGALAPGATQDLNINVAMFVFEAGPFEFTISVDSDDPDDDPYVITVEADVIIGGGF